ncbi:arsenate reductase ArsC [Mariniblastus fucicola]|uniref:Arsenate-mycothiol transferase ArsC2 n=1 Tax=Mariniblastus fucicola TaxID=980251 RepID=A0A5B9P635_9BACT|nr:arsenate reductase ArsC [Mariniblastus fucicola]QEG20979.1 Arsenate-mycothiol transferase ArsC2 [Mariniblastus fucicola]
MSENKKRVLILCTGNSCRSQMAEVIWNDLGEGRWEAFSAGSDPSGYVHPMAIELLKEFELPTEGLTSKSITEFDGQEFDLVVTVCDNAKTACPVFPGASRVLHWPFEDPNDAEGSDEDKMKVFRSVADLIRGRIGAYLAKLKDDDCV